MNSPNVRVVVQARMQSSRLPGKVLAHLAGRPMLEYVVRRLLAAGDLQLLVATSTSAADDAIDDFCHRRGIACFRGSEQDVLGRFVAATADLRAGDLVLRATADNPLYCPERTAAVIAEHRRQGADYTCIEDLSYVVPEVMSAGALHAMALLASTPRCREHVTPYFREAEHQFFVHQLPSAWRGLRSDVRLTVDTPEELERMTAVCHALAPADMLFPIDDVYEYLQDNKHREYSSCPGP